MKIIVRNSTINFETIPKSVFSWNEASNNENKYINILAGLKAGVEYSFKVISNKTLTVNVYDDMKLRTNSSAGNLMSLETGKTVKFTPSKDIDILYLYVFSSGEPTQNTLEIKGACFLNYQKTDKKIPLVLKSNELAKLVYDFKSGNIYEINTGLGLVNIYISIDENTLYSVIYKNNESTFISPSSDLSYLYLRNWSSTDIDNVRISTYNRQEDLGVL